jgi:hypothetical protein
LDGAGCSDVAGCGIYPILKCAWLEMLEIRDVRCHDGA